MAVGTISQGPLPRSGSDTGGIAVIGVCPAVVEGVGNPPLPKRSWAGSRGSKMERRQRLLSARGLVPPTLQYRTSRRAAFGDTIRQPDTSHRLQDRRQAQRG